MAFDTLVFHPTVTHYLAFVGSTKGRDKLLRTVQYLARFYSWYLTRSGSKGAATATAAAWDALKRQSGFARKLLTLGKGVEHARAAAAAGRAKGTAAVERSAAVGRQLAYAAYVTLDGIAVLDTLGVRRWAAAPRARRAANRWWAAALLFSVVAQVAALSRLARRLAVVDVRSGDGAVEARRIHSARSASRLQLVSDLCDLTLPATTLGWLSLHDGAIGLAGTVSSLIGIYVQWKATA